jgi:tricorn protease
MALTAPLRTGWLWTLALLAVASTPASADGVRASSAEPFLLHDPDVSRTQIAFSFAGYIFAANRDGSAVHRLTTAGHEAMPRFSPDGSQIAFTAEYDGQRAIYVVAANGGEPRRLTYHPADIGVVGWTPDGTRVIFSSARPGFAPWPDENMELFTVPATGGFATPLPFQRASAGSLSPDESRIAYVPNTAWQHFQDAWKHYRGGQTQPIWIARLSDSSIEAKVPRNNSNDFNPLWVGDTVYFLSDRAGPVTLFAYELKSGGVRQVLQNHGLDIKSASGSVAAQAIAYEQFGSIHVLDLKSGIDHVLDIRPRGDFPEVRPHQITLAPKQIRYAGLAPGGDAAVFGAHGEILTVLARGGTVSNLTQTTDVSEIDPAWSPNGASIAYFSDESGEYALHIRSASPHSPTRKIDLGRPPAFFYSPTWSPDSRKIAYSDQRLNYWYVDLDRGTPVRIDTDLYAGPPHRRRLSWSSDGRWIAYAKQLPSHWHAIFLFSLEQQKTYQITDGRSDALDAIFDGDGGCLYFTASTDIGFQTGWSDISSYDRPVTRQVYLVPLKKGECVPVSVECPNPCNLPSSSPASHGVTPTELDLDDIDQRIVTLPIPARNYVGLGAGKPGVFYLLEAPTVLPVPTDPMLIDAVRRFDLKTQHLVDVIDDVKSFRVTPNGEHALYAKGDRWFILSLGDAEAAPNALLVPLDNLNIYVDPRREWPHMYAQAWRGERDFLYDPGLHGLDLTAAQRRYEPYLKNLSSREDLNNLFREMLGNIGVGHLRASGGDIPQVPNKSPVGLLGADYAVVGGRYRFTRILHHDPWNAQYRAPLDEPGAQVQVGEYLLALNGRDVRPPADVYSFFEGTANQPVKLEVGPQPDGTDARLITVTPVDDESALRHYAWVEKNRRTVDALTQGRVAYIYVPNTAIEGYRAFNRDFFSQVGKEAAIIDERYNHGGDISDYIVDALRRPLLSYWYLREGRDLTNPMEAIFGPKVMIVNEMSGSGGDALPWMFRAEHLGPLVGTRTWGGLVGGNVDPDDLLDGGFLRTPNFAFYNLTGSWEIENHGVSPDIEVEDDPSLARQGHDAQLEKAIQLVMSLLQKESPPIVPQHPPFPHGAGADAMKGQGSLR